jgi:hypothetical protein
MDKKYEKKRTITQKIYMVDVSFLYIAFVLNKIYPPMKFHVDIPKNF